MLKRKQKRPEEGIELMRVGDINEEVIERVRKSLISFGDSRRGGTGVIVAADDENFYAVTATHCIADLEVFGGYLRAYPEFKGMPLSISLPNGSLVHGESFGYEGKKNADLALVRFSKEGVDLSSLVVADMATSSEAHLLWGFPEKTGRLTVMNVKPSIDSNHILFEEGVKPLSGMSGGPITDENGHVVGIIHGFPHMQKGTFISTARDIKRFLRQQLGPDKR